MTDVERLKYLKLVLRVVAFIAIYATLGVFLIIAARDPHQHLGSISFAIWSSIVHGAVMAVQSLLNPLHVHHLYGAVLALFVIAAVLAFLSPEAFRLPFARRAAKPLSTDFPVRAGRLVWSTACGASGR